jgi:hypothetical protein
MGSKNKLLKKTEEFIEWFEQLPCDFLDPYYGPESELLEKLREKNFQRKKIEK